MSSPRISLTRAGVQDLPELLHLCADSPERPHWPPSAWSSYVTPGEPFLRDQVLLLLRDEAHGLSGWIAGTRVGESAEIEFLLVDPAKRRHGLARILVQSWLTMMKDQGATEALLEVRAANQGARALYRGTGFAEQAQRRAYYRDPVDDAVLMRCELSTWSSRPVKSTI